MTKNEYLESLFDAYTKEEFFSTFGITYNDAENGGWNCNLQYAYDEFLAEEEYQREKEIKEISENNCFIKFILDTPYIGTKEENILTFSKDITEDELEEIFKEYVKEYAEPYYDYGFSEEFDTQAYEEYLQQCYNYSAYEELFVEYADDLDYLVKNFIE